MSKIFLNFAENLNMVDSQHLLEYYSLVDAMNIYESELDKELLRNEYLWNKYGKD